MKWLKSIKGVRRNIESSGVFFLHLSIRDCNSRKIFFPHKTKTKKMEVNEKSERKCDKLN